MRLTPTPEAEPVILFGRDEQKKFCMAVERGLTDEDKEHFRLHLNRVFQNLQEIYESK